MAGVYRRSFQGETMQGERYPAEHMVEVVRLSPTTSYVRTRLDWANGHQCNMWGVAERQGEALVVTRPPEPSSPRCRLTLRVQGGRLTLSDPDNACAAETCGARGTYAEVSWPLSARREIRYLDRLRASEEFRNAVRSYEAGR